MEKEIEKKLENICEDLIKIIENYSSGVPTGICYILGHCIAEGFKLAGYNAEEVTGTAYYKDKNGKNVIYGKSIVEGKNIGFYHTWTELFLNDGKIILDASFKFNKVAMINNFNIKPNKNINDIIITNRKISWEHTYVNDKSLIRLSKMCLEKINPVLLDIFIEIVRISVVSHLGEIKSSA